jgi:CspA family cold shock protein
MPPRRRKKISKPQSEGGDTGTVGFLGKDEAFGFIYSDMRQKNVYMHSEAVAAAGFNSLPVGTRISYEIMHGKKGLYARNIRKLPLEVVTGKFTHPSDHKRFGFIDRAYLPPSVANRSRFMFALSPRTVLQV